MTDALPKFFASFLLILAVSATTNLYMKDDAAAVLFGANVA